jgi:cytochrome b6-f complex iron-sulfur subunit
MGNRPDGNTSRRGFLNWLLGGGVLAFLASVFYPVYKYLFPPESVEANVSQVKLSFTRKDIEAEPKRAKYFKFGRDLGIVFLTDTGELMALSARCTHLDCTVQNRPDLGIIWCACHNGRYTYNGKNISGPPPKPLEQFAVNVSDSDIFISRKTA